MMYRCEATSVEGFIQQLAVGYVARGYLFYVAGSIPEGKEPQDTDERIIKKYGIDVSKFTRCRENKEGIAPIQYLRFNRFFLILAKHGEHRFFCEERGLRNIRVHPVRFAGYSVGSRKGRDGKWHASVRIERTEFKILKQCFLRMSLTASTEILTVRFAGLGFAPYAPVRDQHRILLRAVNKKRKAAGLEMISDAVLPKGRRIVRPFQKLTVSKNDGRVESSFLPGKIGDLKPSNLQNLPGREDFESVSPEKKKRLQDEPIAP